MYDLIIIGGGPAGYHAAVQSSESGLKTLLIEKEKIGGVCLNEGCIPSKTLLKSSKLFYDASHSTSFGVTSENVKLDLASVIDRKNSVVNTLVKGINFSFKKVGVEVINGAGKILSYSEREIIVEVNGENYLASKLLIATGSEVIKPPIKGADKKHVVYNREILDITKLPQNLVVVGGGVIGLELAVFFAEVGCAVTVIEMLDSIGGAIDSDMAKMLKQTLSKKGISFKLGAKVVEINDDSVSYELKNKIQNIDADLVLTSIGRKAVIENIGLENIDIEIKNGSIVTNEKCETTLKNVYAAGDVNGKSTLAHTAYREADVVVNNLLGKTDSIDYYKIPSVIFTHPEAASIGLTKDIAEEKNIDVVEAKLPMTYNGRFLAENDKGRGFCKILIDKNSRLIVGVHIVGNGSSEIIFGVSIMMNEKIKVDNIEKIVFPHPTVSEIFKDTLLAL